MPKKYSHVFSLAFTVDSNNEGENVTKDELLIGLRRRLAGLERNPVEILEACGLPEETEVNNVDERARD